ncbi:MAG TPA: hypothetical protein VF365_10015 [Candidatus Limnocylindria bacterium]
MTDRAPTSAPPTTVLFADPDHGPRSQMAESVFRAVVDAGAFDVASAGTAPDGDLAGVAEVLARRGVPFTPGRRALDMSMAPDLLVVVCEDGCAACPYLPRAKRVIRWPFEDPTSTAGQSRLEVLDGIAEALERRIAELTRTR